MINIQNAGLMIIVHFTFVMAYNCLFENDITLPVDQSNKSSEYNGSTINDANSVETLPITKKEIERLVDLEIETIDSWSVDAIDAEQIPTQETYTHYLNLSLTQENGKESIARIFGKLSETGGWLPEAAGTGVTGESCTGNPRSKCRFAFEGGCECDSSNVNDKCYHKITKD